jgi:modified peptide precursor CbpA
MIREPEDLSKRIFQGIRWQRVPAAFLPPEPFFLCTRTAGGPMKNNGKKDVIAFRKACKADGTGLSHYILMDPKKK